MEGRDEWIELLSRELLIALVNPDSLEARVAGRRWDVSAASPAGVTER